MSDPLVVATIWLAVVTTLLALFTYKLWSATITLAGDTKASGEVQAEKMERSISEAAKAAQAMESVAASMAVNAEQIVKNVEIMDANAEVQRTFGMMNMRAYIEILIGHAWWQTQHIRFQAEPYMKNTGNTPARKIRWRIAADILPVPLPDDFNFPLPRQSFGSNNLGSLQGGSMRAAVPERVDDAEVRAIKSCDGMALYVWGVVTYEDMFRKKRSTEFSQRLFWEVSGPMQEDGHVPEIVKGLHLERHNRTT